MNSEFFTGVKRLPETSGVFNLLNEQGASLFVGAAKNIKTEIKRILNNESLKAQTTRIEIFDVGGTDFIELSARAVRRKAPLYNISLNTQNLYPHFKITKEKFPRLLATRRIEDDAAEYFGAFLPATGARFLLGFSIDTFGLRGCDIPIDGGFPVPCPQFYRKKCVAPCVENLCDEESYGEMVNLARLFLGNRREKLNEIFLEKINRFSDTLDFEQATIWRNLWRNINEFWNDKDRNYWLKDTTDAFDIKAAPEGFVIYLATRRNRKILGRRAFFYKNEMNFSAGEVLAQVLWQSYQIHTPKEISVAVDFPNRKFLEHVLSARAGQSVKIAVLKKSNQKITTGRALRRAEFEYEFDNLKPQANLENVQTELKKEFSLIKNPLRIEAFDVAHISGTDFVGAKSVWESGKFLADEYEFWFSDEKNEIAALAQTVIRRFEKNRMPPDLILIDGGKSQLQAVLKSFEDSISNKFSVISAVKPPRKHNEISHFLTENGAAVQLKKNSGVFQLLLKLRDEAHALANYIHRTKRETAHFYEVFQALPFLREKERYLLLREFRSLSALKTAPERKLIEHLGSEKGKIIYNELKKPPKRNEPFIVPIRYDEPNGEAADLQPLFFLNKNG